jgi:hypothetical protein
MRAMLGWMRRRMLTWRDRAEVRAPAPPDRVMSGKYLSLYDYLKNRYANTVVLTFAEIEDLLGFTLPESARSQQDWWTDADSNTVLTAHSQSWTLASRTARANLMAQTVVFERASA